MTRVRQRNPLRLAVLGLVFIALTICTVYRLGDLPLVGHRGHIYQAAFLDAGGLRAGDRVEVAGVKIGEVRKIVIEGNEVIVSFDVANRVRLGSVTQAEIKVGELLGTKYLDVTPDGRGTMAEDSRIPQSRRHFRGVLNAWREPLPDLRQLPARAGRTECRIQRTDPRGIPGDGR